MNLTPFQQTKVHPLLQKILTNADRNDYLQVIMFLEKDESNTPYSNDILPSEFSSRAEYRKALTEQGKQQLAIDTTVEQTVTALQELSLDIHFQGEVISALLVEGTAAQIIESLNLAGVKSVFLDQIVEII